jgi:hypothetical protein
MPVGNWYVADRGMNQILLRQSSKRMAQDIRKKALAYCRPVKKRREQFLGFLAIHMHWPPGLHTIVHCFRQATIMKCHFERK